MSWHVVTERNCSGEVEYAESLPTKEEALQSALSRLHADMEDVKETFISGDVPLLDQGFRTIVAELWWSSKDGPQLRRYCLAEMPFDVDPGEYEDYRK